MSSTAAWPDRIPIVGTPISLTSYAELLELLEQRPTERAAVVAFCNVHSVMTARRRPDVAAALEEADVATSDGMPLVWGIRAAGYPDQPRVYGPTFMELALKHGVDAGWNHFFYGSTDETLTKLVAAARELTPGVRIAGSYSPPFRPATDDDLRADAALIIESGADLVWVGLGMPKQELWMRRAAALLPGTALLGVGAAFDFLAGTVPQAPMWMQSAGLEWLCRLAQEPGRLWRRYIINNPHYLWLLGRDILRDRLARKG
jgi:N-acetylglucosaminyldiphosphoundecaprenol N-acetyl-beta-D-mannosaminyltransferase